MFIAKINNYFDVTWAQEFGSVTKRRMCKAAILKLLKMNNWYWVTTRTKNYGPEWPPLRDIPMNPKNKKYIFAYKMLYKYEAF